MKEVKVFDGYIEVFRQDGGAVFAEYRRGGTRYSAFGDSPAEAVSKLMWNLTKEGVVA